MNGTAWIWWSAAAASLALLHWVNPWRSCFRAAVDVFEEYQRLWLAPALLAAGAAAVMLWPELRLETRTSPVSIPAAAGGDIVRILSGAFFPESLAGAAALIFLINTAGCAGGFRRGLETVFPRVGTALWIVSLVSAGCSVWFTALQFTGPAEPLSSLLHAAACPWAGVCNAALFAWLLLYAETRLRAPERIAQVEWPVSVAAYTARLWPWALGAAFVFAWQRYLDHAAWGWRIGAWTAVVLTACAPLVMLHVRTARRFTAGMGMAAERFTAIPGPLFAWLAIAAAWLVPLRIGAAMLTSSTSPSWRLPASCFAEFVITAISIRLTAAWIAIQVDKFPPATDGAPRRSPVPGPKS